MLPKTSAYVKSYDGQTKWMYFSIEDNDLLKGFDIKLALIQKKLIANLSIIRIVWKPK